MNPRALLLALTLVLAVAFLAFGVGEAVEQWAEDEYVARLTREVLRDARAEDPATKLTALRDYVRTHVKNFDFYVATRPFLRDTAAETLRTGKGRCGESTRAFIAMARAAGIPAQRLYLEGGKPHIAAAVKADDGTSLIVDSADTPVFENVEPLSEFSKQTCFSWYSSVEWRRLGLLRRLPSNNISLGPFGYLLENPHAFMAFLWLLACVATLSVGLVLRRKLSRVRPKTTGKLLAVASRSPQFLSPRSGSSWPRQSGAAPTRRT